MVFPYCLLRTSQIMSECLAPSPDPLCRQDTGKGGGGGAFLAATWRFPKIKGTLLGGPIMRTIVFWGLYWRPPIWGNYHLTGRRCKRVKLQFSWTKTCLAFMLCWHGFDSFSFRTFALKFHVGCKASCQSYP